MSLNYKYLYLLLLLSMQNFAQVGIGTTTPAGMLDVTSTTNGMLVPRVALTSRIVSAPVVNPQGGGLVNGTLVWNTATAGVAPNTVVPGFYYWNGSAWTPISGTATANNWSITGNAGTVPGTNYLGTTDAQDIRFRTNNIDKFNIGNATNQFTSYNLGSAAAPTFSWFNDNNTGTFSPLADNLGFSTGGVERLRIPAANQIHAMNLGTAALPFYSFSTDPNTGIFSTGADALAFSTAGVQRMRMLANGQVVVNNAAAPFAGDQFSTYSPANTTIALASYSTGANSYGAFLSSTGAGSIGAFARSFSPVGFGLWGRNLSLTGTAVAGAGQNETFTTYLEAGSGGAFSGWDTGVYGFYSTPGIGQGAIFQDDFLSQWNIGHWDGFQYYKIIGDGAVSTVVEGLNGERVVMHCTETPENLFEDYGVGKLTNGKAHITIDPIFAKNIVVNENHPLKVFVQLEGECNGVYVTNKSATSFDVVELQGGTSNVSFSYSIVATRADETKVSETGVVRTVKYGRRFEKAPEIKKRTRSDQKTVSR